MSTHLYAFTEYFNGFMWHLMDPLIPDKDDPDRVLIPNDIAPPWSWPDIQQYITLSGERGLPHDLSLELQNYLVHQWASGDEAYQASWLSLHEIKSLLAADIDNAYPHFNPNWFTKARHHHNIDNDDHIRIIFWHD